MFYLKYGTSMLFKNILLSVILAVQIAVSIFLCGMTVSKVENLDNNVRIFERIRAQDGIFAMPVFEFSTDNAIQKVKKLPGVKQVVQVYQSFFTTDMQEIQIMYYDDYLLENCPLPLSKGQWFKTEDKSADTIPVIVNRETFDHRLGDTFEMEENKYKIIGVLDKRQQYFSFESGGNQENISTLVQNFDKGNPLFLCRSRDFSEAYLQQVCSSDPNFLVLFEKDIAKTQKEQIVSSLNNIGFTKSIAALYEDGVAQIKSDFISLSPYILLSFLLSILGVASSVTLMMRKESYTFSVYYICGIPWGKIGLTAVVYLLELFILAVSLYLIGYTSCINYDILSYYEMIFTTKTFAVVISMFFIIFLMAILPVLFLLKQTQPINILYKNYDT